MNFHEPTLLELLEKMPLEQARATIIKRFSGNYAGSPEHNQCLSWLAEKDALEKTKQENHILSITRIARNEISANERNPWYTRPLGMVLLGVVITIVSGIAVAVIKYYTGAPL